MPTQQQLIEQVLTTIDDAVNQFNEGIPQIQKDILSDVILLVKDLDISPDGTIKNSVTNLRTIGKIKGKLESIVLNDTYLEEVKKFTDAFQQVAQLQNQYFNLIEKDFTPNKLLAEIQKQSINAAIESLTEAGINYNITESIKDILRTNITTGSNYADLTEQLRNSIMGKDLPKLQTASAYRYGNTTGEVVFYSMNEDYAQQYAKLKGGTEADVKKFELGFRKPLVIDLSPKEFSSPAAEKQYIEQGIKGGHDVVIFRDAVNGDIFYAKITANEIFSDGSLAKYARQITTDSIQQFNRQYTSAISDDLNLDWFWYTGSNIETTREWCRHLTAKKYVHRSELPEIVDGNIDGFQVPINPKTKVWAGGIEGTNAANVLIYAGGWNCGHQFQPVSSAVIPQNLRAKFSEKVI